MTTEFLLNFSWMTRSFTSKLDDHGILVEFQQNDSYSNQKIRWPRNSYEILKGWPIFRNSTRIPWSSNFLIGTLVKLFVRNFIVLVNSNFGALSTCSFRINWPDTKWQDFCTTSKIDPIVFLPCQEFYSTSEFKFWRSLCCYD